MHRTYPTPRNPLLDVGDNNEAAVFRPETLRQANASDLLEMHAIAEFWARHSYNSETNEKWVPVLANVHNEIVRRLDAARDHPDQKAS